MQRGISTCQPHTHETNGTKAQQAAVRTTAAVASDASFTERDDVGVVRGTAKLPAAGVPEGQEDGRAARVAAAQPEDKDD